MKEAESQLLELQGVNTEAGLIAYEEIMGETITALEEAANNPDQITGIATGMRTLDQMTGGWQRGDLITLAARPSVGKTALSLAFADAALNANSKVAYFSLEMSSRQLAQRHLCMQSSIDLHRLRTGRLQSYEWVELTKQV